jgi:cytosine/adenosine deaminase-related metal-dependent hydrolase
MTTRIDGAWVVGFDEDAESHVVYEDGAVVFEGDEIVHVGEDYDGAVDREFSGEYLVTPGLVDMHAHLDAANGPFQYDRELDWDMYGVRPKEWVQDPDEHPAFTAGDIEAWARHSMAVLLLTGTTTFADLTSCVFKRWDDPIYEPHIYARTAGELGLRAYLSHRFRSAFPYAEGDGEVDLLWDEERGEKGFKRALRFADEYHGAYDDRIRTMVFPYTLDTVSEDLLGKTKKAADDRGIQVRMHTAQSQSEVERLRERHGMTPVEYLDSLGYLDDNVCLTHCLYPDGQWRDDGVPDPDDETLARIGEAGNTVIYCPLVYRLHGGVMNSFSRYREQGINMALGTDTFPQDIVEEIRWAALGTKLVTGDPAAGSTRELFDAVTLGGARAVGRSDIGRLAPGAKADVVVADISGLHVRPTHDPLVSLVHYVTPADIEHVFVDGNHLVQRGDIPGVDEQTVLADAQQVHDKMGRIFTEWLGDSNDAFPSTYPVDPDFDRSR